MSDGAPALTKLLWQKRLRGADLNPVQYMVLLTLSTYADRNLQHAHPGWARVAADTRLDVRTVKSAARALERAGYIVLMSPGGNQYGKGTANVYRLTLPVVHKGDMGSAPSDAEGGGGRGASRARRGASRVVEGGHAMPPHQVTTSGDHHHSDGQDHRPHLAIDKGTAADDDDPWQQIYIPESWLDHLDDYDELEAWLDGDLNMDDEERRTALGMWENEAHPIAIRNTIIASRRQTA